MNRRPWYGVALAVSLAVASCAGGLGLTGESANRGGLGDGPDDLAFADGAPGVSNMPTTLRLALARPDTLNPAEVSLLDQSAVIAADLLHDGLTEAIGTEGKLRPALARSWSANDDFTVWTFVLDEKRAEADDVAAHFASLLAGDRPAAATTMQLLNPVSSVSVGADGSTVVFSLDRPVAGFAWLMSGLGVSIAAEDGAPSGRWAVDVADDDALHLVPNLVSSDAGGGSGPVERIEIRWEESTDDAYSTLALGLVDGAVAPATDLGDAELRFGHRPSARAATVFYGVVGGDHDLSGAIPALQSAELDDAAERVGLLPIDGLLSPALSGVGEVAAVESTGEGDAQPGASGSLASGFAVTYTDPGHDVLAGVIASGINTEFGVTVEARQVTTDEQAAVIAGGSAGAFAFGWVPGAGSLDAVARPMFGSGSVTNILGYASPEIDRLLALGDATGDDDERWALYTEVHELALAGGRAIPVGAAANRLVVAPQASGVVVRADGSVDLEPRE